MSKKIQVYYGGDNTLTSKKVSSIAQEVIKSYWRLPCDAPEVFKVDINVVPDKEMQEINHKYLNRNKPTDVIAFSLQEGEATPVEDVPLIGQIVISKDTAAHQARELGHTMEEEMTVLLIHGLLHIAGWEEGDEIQKCQETIKKQFQAQA